MLGCPFDAALGKPSIRLPCVETRLAASSANNWCFPYPESFRKIHETLFHHLNAALRVQWTTSGWHSTISLSMDSWLEHQTWLRPMITDAEFLYRKMICSLGDVLNSLIEVCNYQFSMAKFVYGSVIWDIYAKYVKCDILVLPFWFGGVCTLQLAELLQAKARGYRTARNSTVQILDITLIMSRII